MARWIDARSRAVHRRWLAISMTACTLGSGVAWADGPTEGFQEPIIQWGVQPGTTCEDIARSVYGDAKHVGLVTRYNRVTCGGALSEGMTLVLPAAPSVLPAAKLKSVNPQVNARPPGGGWSTAASGQPLTSKSSVNTLDTGRADIQFIDRTRVFLAENTLVIVYGTASQTVVSKQRPPAVELEEGEVSAGLAALRGGSVSVTTKTGGRVDATSRDTVIQAKGQRTTVAVFEGLAKVTNAGATVAVPTNFGTRFFRAKPPSKPRPLPPAPAWATPPQRLLFARGGSAELAANWKPVPKAKAYRVELAREPSFGDLIAREEVSADVMAFRVEKLPPGDYHLRVRAIDDEDFLGVGQSFAAQVVSVQGASSIANVGAGWISAHPYDELAFGGVGALEIALDDGPFGPMSPKLDLARDRPTVLHFRRKGQKRESAVQVRYHQLNTEVRATFDGDQLHVAARFVGLETIDIEARVGPSAQATVDGEIVDIPLTASHDAWVGTAPIASHSDPVAVQIVDRRGRVLGATSSDADAAAAVRALAEVPVIGVLAVPWHLSTRSNVLWWSPTAQNGAMASAAIDRPTDQPWAAKARVQVTGSVGPIGVEGEIRTGVTGHDRVLDRSAWFGLRLRALRIGNAELEAGPAMRVGIPVTHDAPPLRLQPALAIGGVSGDWTWLTNLGGQIRAQDSADRAPIDPGRASLLAGGTYDFAPWLRALALTDAHLLFQSGDRVESAAGLSLGAQAGDVLIGGISARLGVPTNDEPLIAGQLSFGVRDR